MGDRALNIQFPMAGVNRGSSYRQQAPYETRDARNVRGFGTLEGAARGGQRGGLDRAFAENLGGPIHLLGQVTRVTAEGASVDTYWYDEFEGAANRWTEAVWIGSMMPTKTSLSGTFEQDNSQVGGVYEDVGLDTTNPYNIAINIIPFKGRHWGTYKIFFRMGSTPNATANGATAVLTFDSAGAVGGRLDVTVNGSTTSYPFVLTNVGQTLYYEDVEDEEGNQIIDLDDLDVVVAVRADNTNAEFKVNVTGNTVKVMWRGVTILSQAISAPAGERVGMAMQSPGAYPDSICLCDRWTITGYTDGLNERVRRTHLVASAGGDLWVERTIGALTKVGTDVLTDGVPLLSTERTQILYIADHGAPLITTAAGAVSNLALTATGISDWSSYGISAAKHVVELFGVSGTAVAGVYGINTVSGGTITIIGHTGAGNCSFRIVPGVKTYNPDTNAITIMTATAGMIPANCDQICTYRDRIVMAKDHLWYMSRAGDPGDWDYSPSALDAGRAVAGSSTDAGYIGEAVTALIPFSDDYLIFGCSNSLWVLRGDPAAGGRIDNLSYEIGIVSPRAWCHGSLGEVYFLSTDGIFRLAPGPTVSPEALSRDKLPRELKHINARNSRITLAYDPDARCVLINATPGTHWVYDIRSGAFWQDTLRVGHQPYSAMNFKTDVEGYSGAVIGGNDGYIRTYSVQCETDDGYPIDSYVDLGPFRIGDDLHEGKLKQLEATLAYGSGPVEWSIRAGYCGESAQKGTDSASGEWSGDGLQFTDRPRVRGGAIVVRLASYGQLGWVIEKLWGIIGQAGRNRRIT